VKLVVEPERTEIEDGLNAPPVPEDTETVNESTPPLEHALTHEISGARRTIARSLGMAKVIET
jgi:hypothetical protein